MQTHTVARSQSGQRIRFTPAFMSVLRKSHYRAVCLILNTFQRIMDKKFPNTERVYYHPLQMEDLAKVHKPWEDEGRSYTVEALDRAMVLGFELMDLYPDIVALDVFYRFLDSLPEDVRCKKTENQG